jgi:hypothetical protein
MQDATLSDDAGTPPSDDAGDAGDDGGDAGDDGGGSQPACASGQTCVDLVPSGWTGYVQLLVGTADAGAVPCMGPYGVSQATGLVDPVAPPADCSSCSNCLAGDAGPITCTVSIATENYGCLGGGPSTPAVQNACVPVMLANGSVSTPTVASSTGTCAPAAAPAPPSAAQAVVCGLGDGGVPDAGLGQGPVCSSTQACAIPITAPAGSPEGICIYQSGVLDCPPGHFSDQHVVGSAIADDRGCSCGCINPTCPTDGFVTGFAANDCSGSVAVTFDAGAPCKIPAPNIHSSTAFVYHPSHGSFNGTCTAVDAGPSGGVTVDSSGATTYCCIP